MTYPPHLLGLFQGTGPGSKFMLLPTPPPPHWSLWFLRAGSLCFIWEACFAMVETTVLLLKISRIYLQFKTQCSSLKTIHCVCCRKNFKAMSKGNFYLIGMSLTVHSLCGCAHARLTLGLWGNQHLFPDISQPLSKVRFKPHFTNEKKRG